MTGPAAIPTAFIAEERPYIEPCFSLAAVAAMRALMAGTVMPRARELRIRNRRMLQGSPATPWGRCSAEAAAKPKKRSFP